MTTSSRNTNVPLTQASHNIEANAFMRFADHVASPVLWVGETISAACIALELLHVLEPSSQLDYAHGGLSLACFVLHLCTHWRSHAMGHKLTSDVTVAPATVAKNPTNVKT